MSLGREEAALLRGLYPIVLARLVRTVRDLPEAEDAAQDAFARAVERWPEQGLPDNPEAWLLTVARNRYLDEQRRRQMRRRHADTIAFLAETAPWHLALVPAGDFGDDLLALIFTSCDPMLEPTEAAALTLATVVGLSGSELSRLFLVTPTTIQQRLTRARQRLRARRGHFEPASTEELDARRRAVLLVLRGLFDHGYWAVGDQPIDATPCRLAIALLRALHSFERHPDTEALLGQVLLLEARRPARWHDGCAIALPEQDRARWDRELVAEGLSRVQHALARGVPTTFGLEAAIAAVHAEAKTANETDWLQIAMLYRGLEELSPSPVVRVNRAVAVWQAEGAAAALVLLDASTAALERRPYPYLPLLRGTLLTELGRDVEAAAALSRAHRLARNPEEARQVLLRLQELGQRPEEEP